MTIPAARIRFPLAVAIAMIAFLVVFRLAIGAGLGCGASGDDPDLLPTGFVGDLRDNYTYASWAQQAGAGAWLLSDAHTTDPHRAIYFNPYYLFVGRAAWWLDIQPFFIMNVLGLLGAGATVFVVFYIALGAGLDESAARWASVLVGFAMGLSVPAAAVYKLLGIDPMADTQRLGADIWYHDAFGLNCFMTLPYQSLGWALMSLVILAAVTCLKDTPGAWRFRTRLALLAVAAAALASVRPYEPVILLSSYGLFALASLIMPSTRGRSGRIVMVGIVLAAAAAPFVLYQFWVSQQPVWRDFAALAAVSYRSRWSWLIGYGLLLPIAIYGAALAMRDAQLFAARWFIAWLALLVLLLIVIEVRQTKFSSAGTIPVCILAAQGWTTLIARICAIERPTKRRLAVACLFAVGASFFITTPAFAVMLGKHFDSQRSGFSRHLFAAAQKAIELTPGRPPAILCDDATGNVLTGIAPVRVFLGHSAMTPNFPARADRLATAGFYDKTGSAAEFDSILRDAKVGFVLVVAERAANEFASAHPSLRIVGRFDQYVLFQFNPPQAAGLNAYD